MRDIGVVNIGQLDHWSPEIGVYLGEVTLWGKGYGKLSIELALEWLSNHGYKHCHTTILDSNERSIRLFESLGFKRLGDARQNESWYNRTLEDK